MNILEERIMKDGRVIDSNTLNVGGFLNHQLDIHLIKWIAEEIKRRFADVELTKILTIESSGIPIAVMLGDLYGVPVVFAKKGSSKTTKDEKYVSAAYSFTHQKMNDVFVLKQYLNPDDKVLVVDDFLADGEAARAMIDITVQAGGEVVGLAVAVEKASQRGGKELRMEGYHLESIAIVESLDDTNGQIKLRKQ